MASYQLPSLHCVEAAARRISEKVLRTPVLTSTTISGIATSALRAQSNHISPHQVQLFFKCENGQHTRSFKFRGATHFLARVDDSKLANGVVAYSTGNHAQAVALAAQQASRERGFAIPAYVAVPQDCPPKKVEATRSCGGTVYFADVEPAARFHLAQKLSVSTGAIIVPPSDHVDIVLGQATAVAELLDQVQAMGHPPLDAVIVPSGGGGLLVGAVAACKPRGVLVFGAEPAQGGPGLVNALQLGRRSEVLDQKRTIADGLRTLTGEANWEHIKRRENVEGVFTAEESEIREAMRVVVETLGVVIEPSAAVALAVTLFRGDFYARIARIKKALNIGVVLTGGNIDGKGADDLILGTGSS